MPSSIPVPGHSLSWGCPGLGGMDGWTEGPGRVSSPQEESGLGAWCFVGPCRKPVVAPDLAGEEPALHPTVDSEATPAACPARPLTPLLSPASACERAPTPGAGHQTPAGEGRFSICLATVQPMRGHYTCSSQSSTTHFQSTAARTAPQEELLSCPLRLPSSFHQLCVPLGKASVIPQ